MRKIIDRILCTAAALLLLLTLTPAALADGVDAGTDAIEISPEGTVTLISGHIAGEGVCSVQFQLRTEGEVSFAFAGDIAAGYLTNCVAGDDALDVYIAGSTPLIAAGTSRVLGTVTPADKAKPVQSSLQYVYGSSVYAQNAPEADETDDEETSSDARADLSRALQEAQEQFGGTASIDRNRYTADSWAAFEAATEEAESLLADPAATDEQLRAALEKFQNARNALVLTSRGKLETVVDSARAVDSSKYTADSYAALTQALQAAQNALDGGDEQAQLAALEALQKAIDGLVEYSPGSGGGNVHSDGRDSGGGDTDVGQTAAPTETAAPTATPAATQNASLVPATGDETALLPWAAALCLSAGLLALLALRRRTRV